ncbi:MAG: VcbS [Gemmatimonadetes bacterium]|nr:VcbS [Gemmatimonadota bacterium]
MRLFNRRSLALLVVASAAACSDRSPPTSPETGTPTPIGPTPVGVYQIAVTGIGTDHMVSTVTSPAPATDGLHPTLTVGGAGIVFEQVGSSSFSEGARGQGGQRFVSFTYRVRNGTGTPLNNLTMLLVSRAGTVGGTALSSLKRFDGAAADTTIARLVVPTGAAALGNDLVSMQALYPDVIQALTEAEVAAIPAQAGVTNIFPVGYVVRSKNSSANRALPATADPNQFDGLLTLSFRLPLQATSAQDVFSFFFQVLAVTDDETRLTESVEESQDTAAVRRLRDLAGSLGATTVTVLNGSPAMDAAVPDYPGQRQICSARVAGTAGSPLTTIVAPGAYSGLMILRPGESIDPCAAYFRAGTAARPATNVQFTVTVKAVDRYGNVKTAQADTVHLVQVGPPATLGPAAALVAGSASQTLTYTDYGNSVLDVQGRRLHGTLPITVAGVVRTWTAGAGTTDWHTALNWSPAAVPMSLDSVLVPVAAPLFPAIAANVQIGGVTVENAATISLNAFDMTASANVTAGATGGITNTSGRLFLAGTAKTVEGKLPVLRVTGTYSLTANVTSRAPIQVDAGRLTVSALRLQADSN